MRFLYSHIIVFILLLPLALSAQVPHFRKHSLPQQYSNYEITDIEQAGNHYIYFGTSNGVFRFNGIEYKQLLQDSMKNNHVTTLYEDMHGKLWVGYKSGKIGVIENDHFISFSPEEGLPAVAITAFAEDKSGQLWFSTYGEGVYCMAGNHMYNVNTDDGLNDNFVYTLESDEQGRVWAGTDAGIAICTFSKGSKSIQQLTADHGLPDNIVTALELTPAGMLVGTESMGVCAYDVKADRFTSLAREWKNGAVSCIRWFGKDVWVGTQGGVVEINASTGRSMMVSSGYSPLSSRISDIAGDSEGNAWIANNTSTAHFANRTFRFINAQEKSIANIQAILRDHNGNIWYSTQDDVYKCSIDANGASNTRHVYDKRKGINVISMYEDHTGMIWLGTFGQGVYRIDPLSNSEKRITEASGLANNNVLSITGDGDNVWLATLGGVSKCAVKSNDLAFANFNSENGIGSNYIYKVFIDSKKRVWFATDGKGITVLDDGKFINYSSKDGLASNVIYSVTEDSKGNIWFSTSNAGIYRFDGRSFTQYSLDNGLRELNISSITGDKFGNVLIVSRLGIDVLNTNTGSIFYHGQELGISEIDPNLNAFSIGNEGNIWFGTQKGIIEYCAGNGHMQQWPVIRINKLLVFLNETAQDQHEFTYDQNHISFDYIGFWYHDPEEVTYRIKLEGYDREWALSRNRFITYPNLPPGDYTFLVQASATNNFEGAPVARYAFVITPPFYNRAWFYVLCVLASAGSMYWFIKARERKLRAAEALKKDKIEFQFETLKSQVNPHFLFNSFNTLIGVIEEDKETAVEYVEKLSDFYRNILLQREKNVIPLREELKMIDDYYFLQQKRYRSNFIMKINVPGEYLQSYIAPLTLQLLVENAVKHNVISREKPLIVDVFIDNGYIVTRNNLQPKQHPEPSAGVGLSNIINRYKLLSDKEIKVELSSKYYTISIPLLYKAT